MRAKLWNILDWLFGFFVVAVLIVGDAYVARRNARKQYRTEFEE